MGIVGLASVDRRMHFHKAPAPASANMVKLLSSAPVATGGFVFGVASAAAAPATASTTTRCAAGCSWGALVLIQSRRGIHRPLQWLRALPFRRK
jgi:hypothetical protein